MIHTSSLCDSSFCSQLKPFAVSRMCSKCVCVCVSYWIILFVDLIWDKAWCDTVKGHINSCFRNLNTNMLTYSNGRCCYLRERMSTEARILKLYQVRLLVYPGALNCIFIIFKIEIRCSWIWVRFALILSFFSLFLSLHEVLNYFMISFSMFSAIPSSVLYTLLHPHFLVIVSHFLSLLIPFLLACCLLVAFCFSISLLFSRMFSFSCFYLFLSSFLSSFYFFLCPYLFLSFPFPMSLLFLPFPLLFICLSSLIWCLLLPFLHSSFFILLRFFFRYFFFFIYFPFL